MHFPLLFVILAIALPLDAQEINDSGEDIPLPAPYTDTLPEKVTTPVFTSRDLPSGELPEASLGLQRPGEDIASARRLAGAGMGIYLTGFILEYAVSLPLAIVAASEEDTAVSLIASLVGLVSTGFQISGTIRNGVGASMAFDIAKANFSNCDRNINWGFYKAGWAFTAVSGIMNVFVTLGMESMDYSTYSTLSLIGTLTSIASDAMWLTSVINGLAYTRGVARKVEHSAISVYPFYSARLKSGGMAVSCSF